MNGDDARSSTASPRRSSTDGSRGESVVFVEAPGADDQMRAKTADIVGKAGRADQRLRHAAGQIPRRQPAGDARRADRPAQAGRRWSSRPSATPYDRAAMELASRARHPAGHPHRPGGPRRRAGARRVQDGGFPDLQRQPGDTCDTRRRDRARDGEPRARTPTPRTRRWSRIPVALYGYGNGTRARRATPDAAADGGMIKALRDSDARPRPGLHRRYGGRLGRSGDDGVRARPALSRARSGDYGIGPGRRRPVPTPVPTVLRKK